MIQLPTEENIPFTKIRKKFSELFAYLKRVRPIEGGLIEMTPSGFKVNKPIQQKHTPQFHPMVRTSVDEAGGADASGTKLFIKTGYVYGPWDYSGSDSDRLNAINQFPFEPKIGTTLLSADDKPSLTLEPGYTNFILLKIDWHQRVDVIGKSGSGGSFIIAPSLLVNSSVTIDGTTHAVSITSSDASTHNGVIVELSETNYYINNVSIISQTSENMPQENGSTYILMGHYTLDNFGGPTDSRWFLEGPVWTHKHPRVVDSTTDASDRTEPPAPIDPSGLSLSDLHDIPGYVETG